jgi:hypothetical protein
MGGGKIIAHACILRRKRKLDNIWDDFLACGTTADRSTVATTRSGLLFWTKYPLCGIMVIDGSATSVYIAGKHTFCPTSKRLMFSRHFF